MESTKTGPNTQDTFTAGIEATVEKGNKTTGYFFNTYVYCIHNTYNISNIKLQRKTYQDQIKKSFQFQVLQPFFIFSKIVHL